MKSWIERLTAVTRREHFKLIAAATVSSMITTAFWHFVPIGAAIRWGLSVLICDCGEID